MYLNAKAPYSIQYHKNNRIKQYSQGYTQKMSFLNPKINMPDSANLNDMGNFYRKILLPKLILEEAEYLNLLLHQKIQTKLPNRLSYRKIPNSFSISFVKLFPAATNPIFSNAYYTLYILLLQLSHYDTMTYKNVFHPLWTYLISIFFPK